ncbi:hypothetical protein GCM10011416_23810 [Polaribacter pacificus]|uniref:Tyr recombinase domain-containing protein n=1 Tax=Polaribacter pacificus TaxID=1775173 RepID=A0A917I3A0_9FLAO|nr:tyrosine-type recombinase/integrase [Polaribacter pacificus]GGH03950.1 hypothetical protein GCM10011416_23810 [Polaribacter pacificus]
MKTKTHQDNTVLVKKVLHRKQVVLLLLFAYNETIIKQIKSLHTFTYSRTNRGWVSPFSEATLLKVQELLAATTVLILHDSLTQNLYRRGVKTERNLTREDLRLVDDYAKYLSGKRYSDSTVATYVTFIADFVNYVQPKAIETLSNRDVELFFEDVFVPRQYSISSQRQFVSALKLFIAFYPQCNIESVQLERPKKSRILPTVLSQNEVIRLLQVTKNLKHRTVLALLYSAGLRIGELLAMELRHIDISRRQLFVKSGKGRKDRYVILADSFVPLLQNYLLTYRPERYFVEGAPGVRFSDSSIRKFLHKATQRAGIPKKVTPHTLRHSYATHLLENGIGLRHIQELLGHAKPETTMIYTHVAKKDLLEIKSPLDTILLNISKEPQAPTPLLNTENLNPNR